MIFSIGILAISVMMLVHLIALVKPTLMKIYAFKNLAQYSTCDRVFRLLQYACIFCTGLLKRKSNVLFMAINNSHSKQLQRLTSLMSRSRKFVRFIRAPLLFMSIKNRKMHLSFNSKMQTLISIEQMAKLFSDISDSIFFFTDHYGVFFSLGITTNEKLVATLGTLGDIMWICCSSFILVSVLCVLGRYNLMYKQRRQILECKEVKHALMDAFAHINEIILGISFLNPGLLQKQAIGIMAIASTVTRLCKLIVN